jgi:hypothetical protein
MGFQKWILKHGFGSPGHTARTIVRAVHIRMASHYKLFDNEDDNDILYSIYYQRIEIHKKLRNKSCLLEHFSDRITDVVDSGDVPLLIFVIEVLESKKFRSSISNYNIDLVLEVIREEVIRLDDTLVKLDHFEYRRSAIHFLNMIFSYI